MDCKRHQSRVNFDERSVKEQEYRRATRLWSRVVKKHSSSGMVASDEEQEGKREVRFRSASPAPCPQEEENVISPAEMQRRMARMKSFGKRKSPLQKFDEIVTREILNRQYAESQECTFDGVQQWPHFPSGKPSITGRKVSFDTKLSKTTLGNVDRELYSRDICPGDDENPALMEAVERLIQAQASCQFDAAVKAAEAATAMVPPEEAEAVAVACAKDYQSKIIDIVDEKFTAKGGRKPIEVIGYIGITKKTEAGDDD